MKNKLPKLKQWHLLVPTAFLLLITLAALAWVDNAAYRGITFEPAPEPIPWADQRLGVNAFNIQFEPDPAEVRRTLELARDMGAHYIRIQMPWEDIEISGKGDFWDHKFDQDAWAKYDTIVDIANEVDVELIVRIDRPPVWSREEAHNSPAFQAGLQENGNSTGPPADYQDYADFVGAVAERYKGKLRFYQIWNEPNLSYEWNWILPEPERFTEMLKLAYTAIKQADPEALVLFPSLSPTDGLEPRIAPLSELEYLDRVYKAGGADYFDIMSAQAYGLGQPPTEHRYVFVRKPGNWNWGRPLDTRIDVSRLALLREVMERNGDYNTSVWISEFGYVRDSPNIPPEKRMSWGEPLSEEQRTEYLLAQIERVRREWPWVGAMNLWFLRWGGYQEPHPDDPTQYFAVVERDYTPMPSYYALQDYANHPYAGVGAHAWAHPAVHQLSENQWQVTVEGTDVRLAGLSAPVSVSIDNAAPVQYQASDGLVQVAKGLSFGKHTLTIQSESAPSAIVVSRANAWEWVYPSLMLLNVLALLVVAIQLGRHALGLVKPKASPAS